MSPRARIGLAVCAGGGGLFLLAAAGVVALVVTGDRATGPAAANAGQTGGNAIGHRPGAGLLYEDGVTPDKARFARGDRITVVGRIEAFTPANQGTNYLTRGALVNMETDPEKKAALKRELAAMRVEYVLVVRVRSATYLFLMPPLPAAEFEAESNRLTGKRVRAVGTVMAPGGSPVPLTDTRIDVIE